MCIYKDSKKHLKKILHLHIITAKNFIFLFDGEQKFSK